MKTLFNVISSVIIVNSKKQVLIAKRSEQEDIYPGLWGIPGGKLDVQDPNLESALAREVQEEVGVDIANSILIQNNTKSGEPNKLYLVFLAEYTGGKPTAKDEVSEVKWAFPNELKAEEMTPYTYDLILNAFSQRL